MTKKKKAIIIGSILLAIVLIASTVVAIYFFTGNSDNGNGVSGVVSDGWTIGDVESAADSSSKSGTQIPGYSTAEMNAGDTVLHLSIGNPDTNECGFYATLKLEDGTVLYESELIKPGQGLTEVPLNQTLEKGEYTAMVTYQCVTLDEEHTKLNAADSAFTLIVK